MFCKFSSIFTSADKRAYRIAVGNGMSFMSILAMGTGYEGISHSCLFLPTV